MISALVVDDSRTARAVLKQMLVKEGFSVETLESAEAALDFLKENKPDVIFMDHMMPGMDGFAAVKHIKADAATAAIAIVMYTSKEGEVYSGQAHALGAADILNKPASQSELQGILKRLRAAQSVERATEDAEAFVEGRDPMIERRNNRSERRVNADGDRRAQGRLLREQDMQPVLPAWWTRAAAMVVLVALLSAFVHALNARSKQVEELAIRDDLMQSVLWLANKAGHYEYTDRPFEGRRLEVLQELVAAAELAEFKGVITLSSHIGQFCLREQGQGFIVPSATLAISACNKIGDTNELAIKRGLERSGSFRQFVAQVNTDRRSDISIEVNTLGDKEPLVAYPSEKNVRNAGDWNRIAAINNRVEITMRPRQ